MSPSEKIDPVAVVLSHDVNMSAIGSMARKQWLIEILKRGSFQISLAGSLANVKGLLRCRIHRQNPKGSKVKESRRTRTCRIMKTWKCHIHLLQMSFRREAASTYFIYIHLFSASPKPGNILQWEAQNEYKDITSEIKRNE